MSQINLKYRSKFACEIFLKISLKKNLDNQTNFLVSFNYIDDTSLATVN